jgi:hypothetical protein
MFTYVYRSLHKGVMVGVIIGAKTGLFNCLNEPKRLGKLILS